MEIVIPLPWDKSTVSHLPRPERQKAYFVWHKATKKLCDKLGIPMPVRLKRPKAASEAERLERLHKQDSETRRKRLDKDKIRGSVYYQANRVRILEEKRLDRLANPEVYISKDHKWRENNPEKVKASSTSPRARATKTKLHRVKVKTDLSYKLRRYLRKSLWWCVKAYGKGKGRKSASVIVLVGCSVEQLIAHLESLWTDGMSWDNYGHKGWHIDHRIPCSSFDFSSGEEQMKCFHYTNLQPLWATENHKKGARLNWPTSEYRKAA